METLLHQYVLKIRFITEDSCACPGMRVTLNIYREKNKGVLRLLIPVQARDTIECRLDLEGWIQLSDHQKGVGQFLKFEKAVLKKTEIMGNWD